MKTPESGPSFSNKNENGPFDFLSFKRSFYKQVHPDRIPEDLNEQATRLAQELLKLFESYENKPSLHSKITPIFEGLQKILDKKESDKKKLLDDIEAFLVNPASKERTSTDGGNNFSQEREKTLYQKVKVVIKEGMVSYYTPEGVTISPEDAKASGIPEFRRLNGMIYVGNTSFSENTTATLVFERGVMTSMQTGGGSMNFSSSNFSGGSSQEKTGPVENGDKISGGSHTIDVEKISRLESISGGVVNLEGTGAIRLEKISGGVVNINSGVTVILEKISGGVVTVHPGGSVIVEKISGGIVKGKSRVKYERHTGGMIL